MANEEHLKILKQGAEAWNRWRKENPDIKPDLSGEILSKINLLEMNLNDAVLRWANLRDNDLRGAGLSRADLSDADLKGSNLNEVNLNEAFLNGTDLSEAKLRGANLNKANLKGAKLKRTKLSMARLSRADLTGANLTRANLNGSVITEAGLSKSKMIKAELRGAKLNQADLSHADLSAADLSQSKLNDANLRNAKLLEANLIMAELRNVDLGQADLSQAKLNKADLRGAVLFETNFTQAVLNEADISGANLNGAIFDKAILVGANLERAILIGTKLNEANLTDCKIFGISAWNVEIDESKTKQSNLVITEKGKAVIAVDNLEVAQFIYLMLNRKKLRNVIDTITSKSVLVLGRFTPERKAVLDAMADELRHHNLLPIIFDFERAESRDFTETIKTLAGMSLFVIADITNPKSAPLELQATVPDYQIPFVPILEKGEPPFSMLSDLLKYPWVLPLLEYKSSDDLIKTFKGAIINEAIVLHKKLLVQKAEKMKSRSTEDYLKEPE
jgi:uncharacterized protein YjbI with pentapeptide repeats